MNTAFLDAINIAWKLHAVEQGFAKRDILETYESERKEVAESLLSFDNKYAKLFSKRIPHASEVEAASQKTDENAEENAFVKAFKEGCEFTSGYGVSYSPNVFNWSAVHGAKSPLIHPEGVKLRTGHIMINADVTRVVDANHVHLEQAVPLNGSFRIFVFAGEPSKTKDALRDFARSLEKKSSFFSVHRRTDEASVSHHEKQNPHSLLYTFSVVFASRRSGVEITRDVPEVLARYRDNIFADDRWHRSVADASAPAHARMGLDQERGGVVVVRPDGYVGVVAKLVEGSGTVDALDEYFGSFSGKKVGNAMAQL
ncbi:FAD-dependent monooxygenase [Candidatus Bathyarchaeota archaeon]|nr:FAD-dependent monooxygenase [Candidatus Bathyarchaeota archaeon]